MRLPHSRLCRKTPPCSFLGKRLVLRLLFEVSVRFSACSERIVRINAAGYLSHCVPRRLSARKNAVLSNAAHDLQVSHSRIERPSIPPSPTVDLAVYIHNRGTTIRFAAES